LFAGADISNSRGMVTPSSATQLNTKTASKLALKWSFQPAGGVSATPTVESAGLYVPDWAGYLYKLNPATGALIWKHSIGDYFYSGAVVRTSPAIGARGELIIGNSYGPNGEVASVNRTTGAKIWSTSLSTNAQAEITGSPVIYGGVVYVGVTSGEEYYVLSHAGYVPSFRGMLVALDERTGKVLWQYFTVPTGYAGGGVWGSNPAIFTPGHSVIFATGNNYLVPAAVSTCYTKAGSDISAQVACMDPANHIESLIALDLTTGAEKWTRHVGGADTWNGFCPNAGCPVPAGHDQDFGSAPNLIADKSFVGEPDDRGGKAQGYIVGAGQKNGVYWQINPFNGGLFNATTTGPEQILFGSAVDLNNRHIVMVAQQNSGHSTFTLTGLNGVTKTWNSGAWGALDTRTGKMVWQIPAPGNDLTNPSYGGMAPGPVSYSNGLMFAGSTSGVIAAVDAMTGKTYWTYSTGTTVESGPAIFNDTIYWGTGYRSGTPGTPMIYAFAPKT
jgi:polyvinyl alcohol dehydrogenase (cytochrome)